MALLLIAALGILWLFVHHNGDLLGFAGLTKRASLLVAFTLQQVLVVLIAEASSLGHHFTTGVTASLWGIVVVVGCWAMSREIVASLRGAVPAARGLLARVRGGGIDAVAGAGALAGIFGALAVTGCLYPPSNADSMAYHLARVAHWVQDRSVAPFAAHFLAQVELAPLMEYNLATLHLLTASDRWDGYVQLWSAVLCCVGASELARRLGARWRGQLLAAVFVATIPTLVLEATSTTNNVFAAAIGVSLVVVLTSPSTSGHLSGWIRRGAAVGAVAGLAVLSKGTIPAMLGPLLLVLVGLAVARSWSDAGGRDALRRLAAGAASALLLAAVVAGPFVSRNVVLFGGPSGPVTRSTIVTSVDPGGSVGNVLRSVSSEFLIGDGTGVARAFSSTVVGAFGVLADGVGLDETDRHLTLDPFPSPFQAGDFSVLTRFEDVGADPWHTVLVMVACVSLLVGVVRRRRDLRLPLLLAGALCVGFVAFTGAARWTIYATRYYIPLLVVWAPLVVIALRWWMPRWGVRVIAAALVLACLPQLLDNHTRSLLHPAHGPDTPVAAYFVPSGSSPADATSRAYDELIRTIASSSCRRVGIGSLIISEYPLWAGLDQSGWDGSLEHVQVTNESKGLENREFRPCALIVQPDQLRHRTVRAEGMQAMTFGPLTLFVDPSTLPS